jgi:lipoyl(octanoyl) transferase
VPEQSELLVCDLGFVDYREGLRIQGDVRDLRMRDEVGDTLLLLEHPPVYTRGRRSEPGELPMGEAWYAQQGIDIVDVDRGGKLTYHGPGQLVGYPIMRITDVIVYLRTMERAIMAALGDLGIAATCHEGLTGVWVGDRKIGSIGVHISRGVTTHGFAINADNDLQPFEWVVPCGLDGVRMTSVGAELRRGDTLPELRDRIAVRFPEAYGLAARAVPPSALGIRGITHAQTRDAGAV